MLKKFASFFLYNNLVPIIFGVLFLGAGATFAASPEARDVVFSAQAVVASVDNAYIISADIDAYPFDIQITDIAESDTHYFITYTLATIDLAEGVWRDVVKARTLEVEKAVLAGRDLGVYAARQLSETRDAEHARLVETQKIEKDLGKQQKIVATVYGGLVGRMLEPSEEVFTGYTPVVSEPIPTGVVAGDGGGSTGAGTAVPAPDPRAAEAARLAALEARISSLESALASGSTSATPTDGRRTSISGGGDTEAPVITVNGNNPATINVGDTYADLGASVTDNIDQNIGIHTFVDGNEVTTVALDTSTSTTYTIVYKATDTSGNVGEATRTVVVGGAQPGAEPPTVVPETPPASPTATSTPATPPPEPAATSTPPTSPLPAVETTPPPPATITGTTTPESI